jgi:hypothetical protein
MKRIKFAIITIIFLLFSYIVISAQSLNETFTIDATALNAIRAATGVSSTDPLIYDYWNGTGYTKETRDEFPGPPL